MIVTEQKNDFLFVRFTSDLLTACDEGDIKFAMQQALATGTRNVVLSVQVGSLANHRLVSKLLRQCKEIVYRENGNLFFVEPGDAAERMYHTICDTLAIPHFDSEEKIEVEFVLQSVA